MSTGKSTRNPSLRGIEVRHKTSCPNRAEKGKTKCARCLLSFRAVKHDRRLGKGKKARGNWTNNLAQARRDSLDLIKAIENGLTSDAPARTFRDLAEEWIDKADAGVMLTRKGTVYKPSLIRNYRCSLRCHTFVAAGRSGRPQDSPRSVCMRDATPSRPS